MGSYYNIPKALAPLPSGPNIEHSGYVDYTGVPVPVPVIGTETLETLEAGRQVPQAPAL